MDDDGLTIVKVGGSLYDLPDLRERLRFFLGRLGSRRAVLVPGGGAAADAVRQLDHLHHLGEEASHWLAIQAMSLNGRFLQTLLGDVELIREPKETGAVFPCSDLGILDAFPFFLADEMKSDHLPHCWQVTSDSLALRAATLFNARDVILLKSTDWPGSDWEEASSVGIVDRFFCDAMKQASSDLCVQVVNLRRCS